MDIEKEDDYLKWMILERYYSQKEVLQNSTSDRFKELLSQIKQTDTLVEILDIDSSIRRIGDEFKS